MPVRGSGITITRAEQRAAKKRMRSRKKPSKAVQQYVKNYVHRNIENKNIIASIDVWRNVPSITGPDITEISAIAAGTDAFNRIGDSIKHIRTQGTFVFYNDLIGTTVITWVRLMMFYWNEEAAPTVADVLSNGTFYATQNYTRRSQRGRILLDRIIPFSSYGEGQNKVVRFSIPLRRVENRFTSTADTSAIKGRLFFLVGLSSLTPLGTIIYKNSIRLLFEDA